MNRIDRVRVKIIRATERHRNLEQQARAFLDSNPYRVATRTDVATRRLIYFLESVRDVPVEISSLAGDVLQNLRSSLDHLAFELFMLGTQGKAGDGKHVSFPIFDDATAYFNHAPGKMKGMLGDAIAAIDGTQPYQGGNNVLWQIHRLNNIDKHRFLIAVGSAYQSVDVGAHMQQMLSQLGPEWAGNQVPSVFLKPTDRMFPLKPGDELFLDAPDAIPNPKMQFRFEIAFGEKGIIEGESLVETLQNMINTVDSVIGGFSSILK